MPLSLKGPVAELRWSYRRAASLGAWSLDATGDRGRLTAQVLKADAYQVSQRPIVFVVPRPGGHVWRWPVTELSITGTTLSASLGPQE